MKSIANLLQENVFLRTLFESIPFGVMIIDSDRQVQEVNDFMRQAFGVSAATLIDKNFGEVIKCINAIDGQIGCEGGEHCKNCPIPETSLSTLEGVSSQRIKAEVQLRTEIGVEDKVLLITTTPIVYENRRYAILLLEDITEVSKFRRSFKMLKNGTNFIGYDPAMLELREKISTLSEVDMPILIQGESGTGKELVANAIHEEGPRKNKPFIAVNCSALQENLLESELFGHVKGAFTGAIKDRKGRFELANGGTIFLDEIGDISTAMQAKLLRVLQEGTLEPVGSEKTIKINVRVISATNKDIKKEVAAGRFREDLFYRICVIPLYVPPLRERRTDIPLLAEYILNTTMPDAGRQHVSLSSSVLDIMLEYNWPGNVRELQNVIQYTLVQCKNRIIAPEHLPPSLINSDVVKSIKSRKPRKRKIDMDMVTEALNQTQGKKVEAARILNVSRSTLYRFLDANEIVE